MEDALKFKTQTRRMMTAMLLLLGFCWFLAGCGDSFEEVELDAQSFGAKDLKKIEQESGITLPKGSRGLNMYYGNYHIDPSFIAKIEIPASSAEDLTGQMKKIPVKDIGSANPLGARVKWWNPSKAKVQIERTFYHGPAGDFLNLILCEENGHWILYVHWAQS